MGEIGVPRREFLYEMKFWEVRRIIRGYRNRQRPSWEQARLNAFFIMSAMADLKGSGINSDLDLITFPWEREEMEANLPSEEEVADMTDMIESINSQSQ